MQIHSKILITGSHGNVGSAIVNNLRSQGYNNLLTPSSKTLNLFDYNTTIDYFNTHKPEFVFHAAAKVGGVHANLAEPADFIYINTAININTIQCSFLSGVKKFLFVASGSIYPSNAQNPIKEESILTGTLDKINQYYAMAKVTGIKMCEAYQKQYGFNSVVIVPNSTYGPNANYDPKNANVIASLITKFHKAKVEGSNFVEIWGSGNQKREFVYVDDIANGCIILINNPQAQGIYNCGGGDNITIKDLSNKIAKIVGFNGKLVFDTSKPEGHLEKYFDCTKLKSLGWSANIRLDAGIELAYKSYLTNLNI